MPVLLWSGKAAFKDLSLRYGSVVQWWIPTIILYFRKIFSELDNCFKGIKGLPYFKFRIKDFVEHDQQPSCCFKSSQIWEIFGLKPDSCVVFWWQKRGSNCHQVPISPAVSSYPETQRVGGPWGQGVDGGVRLLGYKQRRELAKIISPSVCVKASPEPTHQCYPENPMIQDYVLTLYVRFHNFSTCGSVCKCVLLRLY